MGNPVRGRFSVSFQSAMGIHQLYKKRPVAPRGTAGLVGRADPGVRQGYRITTWKFPWLSANPSSLIPRKRTPEAGATTDDWLPIAKGAPLGPIRPISAPAVAFFTGAFTACRPLLAPAGVAMSSAE